MDLRRRPPLRLRSMAFQSWLKALDQDVSSPEEAPSCLLLEALAARTKLNESTTIRVVQALSLGGVQELDIEVEIVNPTMLNQLARALLAHPKELTRLNLSLSPRLHRNSSFILVDSLKQMKNLRELNLTGGANDSVLEALAASNPRLEVLNISKSKAVTDSGMSILFEQDEKSDQYITESLIHLSLWQTEVTTKGCVLALRNCTNLEVLSSQWTFEALYILNLKNHPPTKLTNLSIREGNDITVEKFSAIKHLCPRLQFLTIHRANAMEISLNDILENFPSLQELTVIEMMPLINQTESMHISPHLNLQLLALSSYYSTRLDLVSMQKAVPLLKNLIIEGAIIPIIQEVEAMVPFEHLVELRLNSSLCHQNLDPDLAIKIVTHLTKHLTRLELGNCENFKSSHFSSLVCFHHLDNLESLFLSGAKNITQDCLRLVIEKCHKLRTVIFKMVPSEKITQLEELQKELKSSNADIEIISFGHRWYPTLI